MHALATEIEADRAQGELRIRQVFETPHPIYRIEFEVPTRRYQRITLLPGDALAALLERDAIREALNPSNAGAC